MEELIATLSLNNAPTGVEFGTPSVTVIRIQDDDGECDHGCICVGVGEDTHRVSNNMRVSDGIMVNV